MRFVILQSLLKPPPNKIEFDGKKCRTTRINDVFRAVLQVDKEFDENNGFVYSLLCEQ